jgi:hypothetical protein
MNMFGVPKYTVNNSSQWNLTIEAMMHVPNLNKFLWKMNPFKS